MAAMSEARKWTREREVAAQMRMLKALAHPTRSDLLGILSGRNISPAEFARERNEPVSNVAYHFRALEKWGCIKVAGTRPARGSTEHFYRRADTAFIDDDYWLQMPDEARRVAAAGFLKDVVGRLSHAIQAGTLTAREDVHITWSPLTLDEQGWSDVVEILNTAFDDVAEAEVRAEERLAESGEEGLAATVAIAGFESPREAAALRP